MKFTIRHESFARRTEPAAASGVCSSAASSRTNCKYPSSAPAEATGWMMLPGAGKANPCHGELPIFDRGATNFAEQFISGPHPDDCLVGLAQEGIQTIQMEQPRLRALATADLAFEIVVDAKQDNETQRNATHTRIARRRPPAILLYLLALQNGGFRRLHLENNLPDAVVQHVAVAFAKEIIPGLNSLSSDQCEPPALQFDGLREHGLQLLKPLLSAWSRRVGAAYLLNRRIHAVHRLLLQLHCVGRITAGCADGIPIPRDDIAQPIDRRLPVADCA